MTNTIVYHVGDVRDAMTHIDDGMVALVVTSPPFLALRSYLPEGHPDKHREIGSEPTPAAFLDTMLALTADWRRVVAPWGSIAVEFGDTYAGSGGAGGDYGDDGLRAGQGKFDVSGRRERGRDSAKSSNNLARHNPPSGWPRAKSLCLIPTLYPAALAYGLNPLTGSPSPAGEWRIRNLLNWTRPNPPVGALGDKFRPATSYVTVACTGGSRWFDLDAVRLPGSANTHARTARGIDRQQSTGKHADDERRGGNFSTLDTIHLGEAGAPPLDWWDANDLADDMLVEHWQPLHRLPTSPYKGSHYATFPEALPRRLIEAMCPREVCTVCGEPRRRITERTPEYAAARSAIGDKNKHRTGKNDIGTGNNGDNRAAQLGQITSAENVTVGWTNCGHGNAYTPGIVLDPFGGSGTTAVAAARAGRDAILIDLDARNRDLARHRIAESLRIVDEHTVRDTTVWTVDAPLPNQRAQAEGQRSIFDELEAIA